MKEKAKRNIGTGIVFIFAFIIFTLLVQTVDVQALGVNGTDIGFAALNRAFHEMTGVHMSLYTITDWLGLVPIFVAFGFGVFGFVQLVKRKNFLKVDADILILGVYYIVVASLYIIFEMTTINYRPVLIEGFMETSYPSSTTLLVLAVLPTAMEQLDRRLKNGKVKKGMLLLLALFSVFMVIGRLLSGVHWLTDIVGSVFVCIGLFNLYKGCILLFFKENERRTDRGIQ